MEEFLNSYKKNQRIKNHIEQYVIFEFTSERINIKQLKQESDDLWNGYYKDHPLFKNDDSSKKDDRLKSRFYHNLPYKIDDKLKQLRKLNPHYDYEYTMFNAQYFLIENKILNAIDLHDEIM